MAIPTAQDQAEIGAGQSNWIRLARVVWYVCALAAVGMILVSLLGYWQGIIQETFIPPIATTSDYTFTMNLVAALTSLFAALVSLLLAVVLFWRKADDVMALFLSFFLLGYSVILAGPLEVILDHFGLPVEFAYIAQSGMLTLPWMAFSFLFPSGKFVPGWTRWTMAAGLVFTPLMLVTSPAQWFKVPILEILILFIIMIGVYAQIFRFRNVSSFSERQQTKWVLFGFLLFVGMILITYPFFITVNNMQPGEPLPWWLPLTNILWWLTMCIMPVTIFIAIQRNSLWDIDLIIRKTLVYGAITLLLALVYFGSVVLLQQAFRALTGQDSPVAIVISTLVIAALFNPLRRRVQEAIDHRFYRRKYDAQQALGEFAATARDEVELDQLTEHLLSVVQESMQPEQVSLWLRAGEKK
jgi:hypothetical protein